MYKISEFNVCIPKNAILDAISLAKTVNSENPDTMFINGVDEEGQTVDITESLKEGSLDLSSITDVKLITRVKNPVMKLCDGERTGIGLKYEIGSYVYGIIPCKEDDKESVTQERFFVKRLKVVGFDISYCPESVCVKRDTYNDDFSSKERLRYTTDMRKSIIYYCIDEVKKLKAQGLRGAVYGDEISEYAFVYRMKECEIADSVEQLTGIKK